MGPVLLYKVSSASESILVTNNMFTKCVIFAAFVAVAVARSAPAHQNSVEPETPRAAQEQNSYFGDLRYMYKVYQECTAADLSSCLKLKLVAALDRVAKSYPQITLFDGVSFVKESNVTEDATTKTEAEIEASLPRSLSEKDDALNSLIADKVGSFFETHTLQVGTICF